MTTTPVLQAFQSGFDQSSEMTRLHCNENPGGPPRGVVEVVAKEVEGWCAVYPDSDRTALRDRLGEHFGVSPDMVAVGNGADELLLLIALAFLRTGDEVLVTESTFPGYAAASAAAGAVVHTVEMRDYRVPADVIARRLTNATDNALKLVFVCNPHNPTGTMLSTADVDRILAAAETSGVVPVFDEAYIEFADEGREHALDAVRAGRRLIVLRTFSKAWGLASLRAGYAVGPADLMARIRRTGQTMPFSVNRLAQQAALAALDVPDHLREVRERNSAARQRLCAGLTAAGVAFVPPAANFVLVRVPGDSAEIAHRLATEHQILVRELSMYGWPGHLRVTVGTPTDVDRFCAALADVLPTSRGLGYGLGAAEGEIEVPTLAPVDTPTLFNGYVGANVVFALNQLGVWEALMERTCTLEELAAAGGADQAKLLTLLRAAALLGHVEVWPERGSSTISLTTAGRELARHRGFFTWGVGGYSTILRGLADFASGRTVFDSERSRDGSLIAAGSGEIGRSLMIPIENRVLSGIDFTTMADLGCGNATRLLRLCGTDDTRRGIGIETDASACAAARAKVAEAGMVDRVEIVQGDVLEELGERTFPGVELVSSYLMMHDLFEATGDPSSVTRLLRRVFPDAKWFLVADTVAHDWQREKAPLPLFSLEFELVHAFMDTPIIQNEVYETAFADAGLTVRRQENLVAPSTYLWLLSAD